MSEGLSHALAPSRGRVQNTQEGFGACLSFTAGTLVQVHALPPLPPRIPSRQLENYEVVPKHIQETIVASSAKGEKAKVAA